MKTIANQAKDIILCLEGVVPAFECARIGSADYRDKAMVIHRNVTALAQLHPNWSEEQNLILTQKQDDTANLNADDTFILIYEYAEQLFRAWHQMRVPRPSVRALSTGSVAFWAALINLRNECNSLTNRKTHTQKKPSKASCTMKVGGSGVVGAHR